MKVQNTLKGTSPFPKIPIINTAYKLRAQTIILITNQIAVAVVKKFSINPPYEIKAAQTMDDSFGIRLLYHNKVTCQAIPQDS